MDINSVQEVPEIESQDGRKAEQAVLGAVLINYECFENLKAMLMPHHFSIRRHGWIWQAFINLSDRNVAIDYLTVCDELQQIGKLEEIGGDAYITSLLNATPTSWHAAAHAEIMLRDYFKRWANARASEIAVLAQDPGSTSDELRGRFAEIAQEATGSATKRYIVRDATYIRQPIPPVEYLVDELIYKKSITVLFGDGGVGKTWAATYLAACVASEHPWGNFNTHPARVLFVDEENGDDEMRLRSQFSFLGAMSEVINFQYISLAGFHLDNPQDEAQLTNEILAQEAGLVILDALADLMIGDENSKKDTQPVFNALRRITERTGVAILLIHHANKDLSKGYRGSSVIKDAVDTMIQVESDPDSNFINFKFEKKRKGKKFTWTMYATWTEDSFYLNAADPQEKTPGKGEEFVLRYLKENGATEKETIIGSADTCSASSAETAIYKLAKAGKVYRTNPTGNLKIKAIFDLVSVT